MKKDLLICATFAALALSGCDTYEGQGAFLGSGVGAVLGSSIGDLAGGWNGSDVGTIVGMAGGAVVGGAIGAQQDRKLQSGVEQSRRDGIYYDRYSQSGDRENTPVGPGESGFDSSNRGDDRIDIFNDKDNTDKYSTDVPESGFPSDLRGKNSTDNYTYNPNLKIRNARFVDSNQDNRLNSNEICKIIFEIYNTSDHAMADVVPTVIETSGNKHIYISPSIHIEKIDAGRGIRYTAVVKADRRLKNGKVRFCISVIQGNRTVSKISEFNIPTCASK